VKYTTLNGLIDLAVGGSHSRFDLLERVGARVSLMSLDRGEVIFG
jgi:hypothetical protein